MSIGIPSFQKSLKGTFHLFANFLFSFPFIGMTLIPAEQGISVVRHSNLICTFLSSNFSIGFQFMLV